MTCRPVKIEHQLRGDDVRVEIHGELSGDNVECLTTFWHKHLAGGAGEIRLELGDFDIEDASAVARVATLIREGMEGGQRFVLVAPPQMLAHTLYKVASLRRDEGLRIIDPRQEEPYAG